MTRRKIFPKTRRRLGQNLSRGGLSEEIAGSSRTRCLVGFLRDNKKLCLIFFRILPQDVGSLKRHGQYHVQVEWKDTEKGPIEKVLKHEDIENFSKPAAKAEGPPADLCADGVSVGILNNDATSEGQICIQWYYRGALQCLQVWDHVWDCLMALEDSELLVGFKFIGTAKYSA
jgi:hypothetical protein